MKTYNRYFLFSILFFLSASVFVVNANAQVGRNNLFCPAVPYTEGMLNLQITALGDNPATFSAGMIGTFENIGNGIGDIDWMPTKGTSASGATLAPTNEIGSQLITWWSRKDNRNTQIQVTNHAENTGPHTAEGLNVHIRIFSSDCNEIRDFCDTFTPLDSHVYNLSDLVSNIGTDISERNLADKEGILIITPVDECSSASLDEQAIDHNFLSGNVYITDILGDTDGRPIGYTYGTNMYARQAVCNAPRCTGILNGSANARFDVVLPDQLFGLFNTPYSNGGSDVVVINFYDHYGPPYRPTAAAFSNYVVSIFDNNEVAQSCGEVEACFLRLGIDSTMPARQDFTVP